MAAGHPEYTSDSVAGLVLGIPEDRHVSIIPNYPSWRNRPGNPPKRERVLDKGSCRATAKNMVAAQGDLGGGCG